MTLNEIAYDNGLELIQTTAGMNGYPQQLQDAIIGFDTFKEAEKLAKEYDLSIEVFNKRDGWDLWYRTGSTAWEAFERSCEDYGEDYAQYANGEAENYVENEVRPFLNDIVGVGALCTFIQSGKKTYDKIKEADDDELVITRCGQYYDTVKKRTMAYEYDTHHYAIGLINRQ